MRFLVLVCFRKESSVLAMVEYSVFDHFRAQIHARVLVGVFRASTGCDYIKEANLF